MQGRERSCQRALPSPRVGLWELAAELERTHAAGICETQGLKPVHGSYTLSGAMQKLTAHTWYFVILVGCT